ncbi:hypothetical protein H1R20_g13743, partial [Candolleomyces eurysporus]
MPVGTRKNPAPASPVKAPARKRDRSPAMGASGRRTRRKKGEEGNDSDVEFDVADERGIEEEDRQAGGKGKKPGSARIAARR